MQKNADRFDFLDIVAEKFGTEVSDACADALGGLVFCVPKKISSGAGRLLCAVVGAKIAQSICDDLNGVRFHIRKTDARHRMVLRMARQGAKTQAIADAAGISERHVYRICAVRRRRAAEARQQGKSDA